MFLIKTILLTGLLAIGFHLAAQPVSSLEAARKIVARKLDSLPYLVKKNIVLADGAICNLPGHYVYSCPGVAGGFPADALHLPPRDKHEYIEFYALFFLVSEYYEKRDYQAAQSLQSKALQLAVANGWYYEELHLARPAINNLCIYAGNYAEVVAVSMDGRKSAITIDDQNRIWHFDNVLGYIHTRLRNYTDARTYIAEAMAAATTLRDKYLQAKCYEQNGELALAEARYDSARFFFDHALALYKLQKTDRNEHRYDLAEREALILSRLARVYSMEEKPASARIYIDKAMAVAANSSINQYDRAAYLVTSATIDNQLRRFRNALDSGIKGLDISAAIHHRENFMQSCLELSVAYKGLKRADSALHYLQLYAAVKDSLDTESMLQQVMVRQTNEAIAALEASKQHAIEKEKLVRNITLVSAGFILVVLYLLYNRYRLRQENKLKKEQALHHEKLVAESIATQNRERIRIAQDLHDELGSILSAAKLKLSSIPLKDGAAMNGYSDKVLDSMMLINDAVTEMKHIAYNIMPATLQRHGLLAAIEDLTGRIGTKTGLEITFISHGFTGRITGPEEISIYMMVLECINNVVKHSGATKATIQLLKHEDYINIIVEDNGAGFDVNNMVAGNGLQNIRSRTEHLKGSFHIDSSPGNGTSIVIDIPAISNTISTVL